MMTTILDGLPVKLDDIDEVVLQHLAAVGVYRGPSEVPPELDATGEGCGVVVMWTRSGDPGPAGEGSTAAPRRPRRMLPETMTCRFGLRGPSVRLLNEEEP